MNIKDFAKICYKKETESAHTKLKVMEFARKRVLWEGEAKDLENALSVDGIPLDDFVIVEILVDWSDCANPAIYNKNKIITVA